MARRLLGRTSVRDALDSAVIALQAAGCDTPRLDAELLLAHALSTSRETLFMDPERDLSPDEARAFMDLAARRRSREPVAYILGEKGFRRLMLRVDSRVLVPRPETEFVVEAALSLPEGARVVDVGTGSGAIALALKEERPDLEVLGTDSSADALEVARGNAERLGLDVERFREDLRRHRWTARVELDVDSADLSGVSGTPTFFINERRHQGANDIATLSAAVKTARRRVAARTHTTS